MPKIGKPKTVALDRTTSSTIKVKGGTPAVHKSGIYFYYLEEPRRRVWEGVNAQVDSVGRITAEVQKPLNKPLQFLTNILGKNQASATYIIRLIPIQRGWQQLSS